MKNSNKNITNEKNLKYIVYITTNLINYKKYIGSHVCKDLSDGYLGSGTSLIQALKKYSKLLESVQKERDQQFMVINGNIKKTKTWD